ncbi:hypothetical protein MB27_23440 [Actinoplanes utahensis]|uniref:Ig-like domain (Group 3) n=1 Tax=Actinoplanes utahensis TaxID=1869 RepID=A0A0A6UIY4_ACTUT|nr:hypothetical protein MB27_23440 [Actinoplanes utahensis]GIF33700.1 hypothetical protein Aut01nite_66860 [Actinoplanes utahensis]
MVFTGGRRRGRRTVSIVAVASGLVAAAAGPASAEDPAPDVTAPVITDLGIEPGKLMPRTFKFEPVVTDDVGVAKIEGSLAGQRYHVWCSLVSCTVETTNVEHDAEVPLAVWATDVAGNKSEVVTTTVRIDRESPTATLSPAVRSTMKSGPVTITLSKVPEDIATIEMTAGYKGEVLDSRTEGPWVFTWNAVAGAPRLHFRFVDRAGNEIIASSEYVVDDDAPIIERVDSVSTYSPGRVDLNDGWVGSFSRLSAKVRDASKVTRIEWRLNGKVASNSFEYFWIPGNLNATQAVVTVQVWDALGHASAPKLFRVNIDSTAPAMTVTPAEGALIRGTTFRTSVKATDPHGVSWVQLQGPDNPTGSRADTLTVPSGRDGARTVTWLSVDNLGNSVSADRTVIVDNTAPVVGYKSGPKNLSKLTGKTALTAAALDRNGILGVQLLVNGKVVATDVTGPYSFVLDPKKYGTTFTVQFRGYDKAGNYQHSAKLTYRR